MTEENTPRVIDVRNAEDAPNTKATIIHQNSIDYEPKVSVIIPVYNTEKYLRECLDSVVNQTLKEIEIICVDDGSTDSSLEILKEYAEKDNRFTIITQENLHAGVARNAGLAVARGEYVYFLDSDDYIKICFIEKMYTGACTDNLDLYICKRMLLDCEDNIISNDNNSLHIELLPQKVFAPTDIKDCIFQFSIIGVTTKLYNLSFLKEHNIYYQNIKTTNDIYFNHLTLALARKIYYIDEALVVYRYCRKDSLTLQRGQSLKNIICAYTLLLKQFNEEKILFNFQHSLYKRAVANINFEISQACENRNSLVKAAYKFLPKEYHNLIIHNKEKKVMRWYQFLFSIKNINQHKQFTILGLKIKKRLRVKNIVPKFNYRTFSGLANIIRNNICNLPNDIDLIVGVPRSGMIPAYMLALFLNKRVCSLPEFIAKIPPANGERNIIVKNNNIKNILIVDDSINQGTALIKTKKELNKINTKDLDIKYLAIFATKESCNKVDYYFEIVSQPRIFQWNYLNHSIAKSACYDFDGVLCVDPTDEQNDDGERYLDFILNAKPLYIPAYEINSIVTSRLEKYRKPTEEWLKRNGVKYKNLYMLNLNTAEERRRLKVHAKFKSKIYKNKVDCSIFIESDYKQAKEIAKLSGKPVICTGDDMYYQVMNKKEKKSTKQGLNLIEKIFSIKNKKSRDNKWYKVITIFGLKFKYKNKELTQIRQLQAIEEKIAQIQDLTNKNLKEIDYKLTSLLQCHENL